MKAMIDSFSACIIKVGCGIYRRLGHANMDLISQINKYELVRGLPKINFQKDKVFEACQVGK